MSTDEVKYIPDAGNSGTRNKMGKSVQLRSLTKNQEAYMEHYFDCNGSPTCIAKRAKFYSREVAFTLGKSKRVQIEIARRTRVMGHSVMKRKAFNVTKEDRLELLWLIATGGAERITDKEGNMVFMNPAVSVSAIRTINEMLPGSLAPKEVEVTHKIDTRSEDEIRDNIAKLNEEYQSLIAIDGTTIRVKESDIIKSESLPIVHPDGHVTGVKFKGKPGKPGKMVHVPARPVEDND